MKQQKLHRYSYLNHLLYRKLHTHTGRCAMQLYVKADLIHLFIIILQQKLKKVRLCVLFKLKIARI